MKQRLVIAVILFSMGLHCSGRIGLLSYLYQQRLEIAHTIGLIAEIPIALCSSDYGFNPILLVEDQGDQESIPSIIQAHEINLFLNKQLVVLNYESILLTQYSYLPYREIAYSCPYDNIFQPPRV